MKAFLSFLIIIPFTISGLASAADRAGDVVSVRGPAFIERDDNDIEAETRDALFENDNVRTGDQARMKMLFRDDSILTLGSKSRLIVRQYLYSSKEKRAESVYELIDGKLRAVVGNAGLTVKTPTAFAAARGTVFIIWYDPDRKATGIAVLEGEVEIKSINPKTLKELILKGGEITYVYHDSEPQDPTSSDFTRGTMNGVLQNVFDSVGGGSHPDAIDPGMAMAPQEFNYPEWFVDPLPPIDQAPFPDTSVINIDVVFP